MAQYVEGPYIVEDQPDGTRKVVGYANQQQGGPAPMTIGSPKPKEPEKPQNIQRKDGSIVQVYPDGRVVTVSGPTAAPSATPTAPKLTAKERSDAIAQYIAADRVLRQQGVVQGLFNQSAGATDGVAGLLDLLPTPKNDRLNTAGQRLRADMKKLQGFTGGEGNTLGEASLLYDPFLVSSRNLDQTAQDKIANMADIAKDARREAIMILGGVPDANGRITPLDQLENPLEMQDGQDSAAMTSPVGNIPPAPQGPDRSAPLPTGPSFGGPQGDPSGFVPYGSTTRRIDNPEWKGVNEAVKGMIIAGQSPDAIRAYLGERGINTNVEGLNQAADYFRKTGRRDFRVNVDDIEVPMSGFEQFRNNAPQTAVGAGLTTAANAASFGIPQALAPEQMQYIRDQNPVPSFFGDVAGIVGATSGIGAVGNSLARSLAPRALTGGGRFGNAARAVAPDAAYGAAYGGITEGDPLTGAATAAAGSGAGQLVGKGLQKTFQGVSDPAVQYLTERGIPLTIGQTLGNRGIVGRMANKMESVPVLGDMLARNRMDGLKAFEREALNDVVSPIGGRVTTGGTEGLEQAQGAVSQAYGDALSGVNVRPDAQFMTDAQAAMQAGAAVPKFGEDFTYMMNKEVGPVFGQTGQLSGPQLQSALQSLGKMRSGFAKNPDAMAGYAADATSQMDDALTGLVSRQSPDTMPAYNQAKGAFQRLAPFENARMSAINQEAITPAQLARSITNNTKNFGGRAAAARGDNLTDLIRYGQEVLPPTVPNSGTADRFAGIAGIALPTALGGTSYAVSDMSPSTAAGLAALAALSTKAGQKAAQKALTKRPKAIKRLGGIFGRRETQKGLAGMVTAPLLIED